MGGHQIGYAEFVLCSLRSESGAYHTTSTADLSNTVVNASQKNLSLGCSCFL